MVARPLQKVDWEARCRTLEARDAERANALQKANTTARAWKKTAERERDQRVAAEANAMRFHALLLQERVRKIGQT